mmetsp:Transcript_74168/g.191338  ORF Transcript_74168/g.191338 Transcript_74168/m.191338 type:complete len:390 (+) Transcript_74168:512-1681(+)
MGWHFVQHLPGQWICPQECVPAQRLHDCWAPHVADHQVEQHFSGSEHQSCVHKSLVSLWHFGARLHFSQHTFAHFSLPHSSLPQASQAVKESLTTFCNHQSLQAWSGEPLVVSKRFSLSLQVGSNTRADLHCMQQVEAHFLYHVVLLFAQVVQSPCLDHQSMQQLSGLLQLLLPSPSHVSSSAAHCGASISLALSTMDAGRPHFVQHSPAHFFRPQLSETSRHLSQDSAPPFGSNHHVEHASFGLPAPVGEYVSARPSSMHSCDSFIVVVPRVVVVVAVVLVCFGALNSQKVHCLPESEPLPKTHQQLPWALKRMLAPTAVGHSSRTIAMHLSGSETWPTKEVRAPMSMPICHCPSLQVAKSCCEAAPSSSAAGVFSGAAFFFEVSWQC